MPLMNITAPGVYEIRQDMTQMNPADDAIRVAPGVHYVTLLLYGRIVGGGGPGSNNSGISASGCAALSIIGMGGSVRGFYNGILSEGAFLTKISDVSIQDAYFRGIRVDGEQSLIADNDIGGVTGCTFHPNAYCMGIEAQGLLSADSQISILRNTVRNVKGMGTGESIGISLSDKGTHSLIKDNAVINRELHPGSFGYWVGGDSDPAFVHNHADTFYHGVAFSSPPTGFVDENSYRNCTIPILDSGGDVIIGPGDMDE